MAPHADPETAPHNATVDAKPVEPTNQGYKSLSHLQSYPLISDITTSFTSSPLGQRTISLSTSAYSRFITPLSPYLSRAYPYVQSADDFADANLTRVDSRFPVVKEVSAEDVKGMIGYPRKLVAEVIVRGSDFAREKQEYVLRIYEDEVAQQKGVVGKAKAGVTTGLVVSSDVMGKIAGFLASSVGRKASVPATNGANGANGNGATPNGEKKESGA